jgi:Ca-activated chloride channel family protein
MIALLIAAFLIFPVIAPAQTPLSRADRKERLRALDEKYRQFLEDVDPIISPKERETFLQLESDPQRDVYIDDFWKRHTPAGMSTRAFHDEYYARLEEAAEKFRRGTDRFRVYMIQGRPIEIIDTNCNRYVQPIQLWRYPQLPGLGHDATLLFYIPRFRTDYMLWNTQEHMDEAYKELLSEEGLLIGWEPVFIGRPIPMTRDREPPLVEVDCHSPDLLLKTINYIILGHQGLVQLRSLVPEPVEPEPINALMHSLVLANPNAPKLNSELTVRFPRKDGTRTDAEVTLLVPRAQLAVKDVAGTKTYSLDVTGEVLHDAKMYEKYRYRFDFPAADAPEKLPLLIDRILPHGDYTFRIKVVDPNSKAEAVLERLITVPEMATTETAEGKVVSTLAKEAQSPQTTLRIAPMSQDLVSGFQHIETVAQGDDIKAVEFYLDGRKVMTKRQPPYTLDLDFGHVPQPHKIRVIALDAKAQPIAGDELVVNSGTDPFRVRIVSPRLGIGLKGRARVEMAVTVPEGKQLDHLQLFLNETPVATLYDPPYVQTISIPPSKGVTYLRAVATLKDDPAPPVEDVVMLNTPQYMEEVNVHLVELPTTVIVNGRPVTTLTQTAFQVFDEGKPVKLARFEQVKDLPLSIGMAIDTSASMQPRLGEAQKAGALFLKSVLKPGDKAFLVSFDAQPQLLQKWSPAVSDMNAALSKLRAEESTALYDAIVYSLYNFVGVKGQKALVVITDGQDNSSKFTFDQAVEYARRAAVPIYGIGIGIHAAQVDVRYKFGKFCSETGGNVYYIDNASDLSRIYEQIQDELRSQYVLGFYPAEAKPGSQWHEVTVQVSEGKAKTIRGYYP